MYKQRKTKTERKREGERERYSRVVEWTWKCSLLWSFFLLIRIHIVSRNKLSLVSQAATLGNFFNLHKCKMATARYVNMCDTRTAFANIKCNTSFKGSFVQGIQN